MADEELLASSVSNPKLFEELVNRYQAAFLRKATSILRSQEDAEDCVQETFVKIYFNAGKFQKQEGASFKSWGYKILINTTLTRYAKLKKVRAGEVALDDDIMEILPDHSYEKDGFKDEVVAVLQKMPDHLSRVLRMQFIEGWSQEDIAKEEDSTVSAIKTRVHRAKKEFKKVNEQYIN